MTPEDKKELAKDLNARVSENYNGWYTIEIYYKGELIKTVQQ